MFRPCIDLHAGKVKQIVGSTLESKSRNLRTHFVSQHSAAWYAQLYQRDQLKGGHIIMLGSGNDSQARQALAAYRGGMQLGGGVNPDNARSWLEAGASHVIVTSWVFHNGQVEWERLRQIVRVVGKERLVLDLSCRRRDENYFVVTDRWQKFTKVALSEESLAELGSWCAEFLIHAVDMEGLCSGIDQELVRKLALWTDIPVTYAGGANSIRDLEQVDFLSQGKIDLSIGSALDLFGGTGVNYDEAVAFNRRLELERLKSAP